MRTYFITVPEAKNNPFAVCYTDNKIRKRRCNAISDINDIYHDGEFELEFEFYSQEDAIKFIEKWCKQNDPISI